MSETEALWAKIRELENQLSAVRGRATAADVRFSEWIDLMNQHLKCHDDQLDDHERRLKHLLAGATENMAIMTRAIDTSRGYDEQLGKHAFTLDADIKVLQERMNHVELTIFPNMADDIIKISDIIGTRDTERNNPLDRKKT